MIKASVQITGSKELVIGLRNVGNGIRDLRIPAKISLEYLQKVQIKEVFKNQGIDSRWKPLSANYKKWKEKHYPGRPILILRGRLYAGLRGNTKDSIQQIRKNGFTWGVSTPYARVHQVGGVSTNTTYARTAYARAHKPDYNVGRIRIPKRRYLGLRVKDIRVINRILLRHLRGLFKTNKFRMYSTKFGGVL
jgi:phage gpG-like protein